MGMDQMFQREKGQKTGTSQNEQPQRIFKYHLVVIEQKS